MAFGEFNDTINCFLPKKALTQPEPGNGSKGKAVGFTTSTQLGHLDISEFSENLSRRRSDKRGNRVGYGSIQSIDPPVHV